MGEYSDGSILLSRKIGLCIISLFLIHRPTYQDLMSTSSDRYIPPTSPEAVSAFWDGRIKVHTAYPRTSFPKLQNSFIAKYYKNRALKSLFSYVDATYLLVGFGMKVELLVGDLKKKRQQSYRNSILIYVFLEIYCIPQNPIKSCKSLSMKGSYGEGAC